MIRSYEIARKRKKRIKANKLFTVIKIILCTLILYSFITHFLIKSYKVNSISMQPNLNPEDRILSSPLFYGPFIPLQTLRFSGFKKPERGDIVMIIPPYNKRKNNFQSIFEPITRFFTLQRASIITDTKGKVINKYCVKRIIGIPGDTIKMNNFIAYIKTNRSDNFIEEKEIIKKEYALKVNQSQYPMEWKATFPFSGNVDEITLKENEYFVLGDNRSESNDSVSWGPLNYSHIAGKIVFRFWPLNKFETF